MLNLDQPSRQEDFRRNLYYFAPPKMTTAERDEMKDLVTGMIILNTTTTKLEWWDGTNWVTI
jgi:hypothetical protein